MKFLSLDTSTESLSVAIFDEFKLLGEITLSCGTSHSIHLADSILDLLKFTGNDINDIDCFAVGNGPGSFTGLRIAYATVKGMAFGSEKDLISISSLLSMVTPFTNENVILCPIVDAMRQNVYNTICEFSNNKIIVLRDDNLSSFEDLSEHLKSLNKKVMFIGSAVYKFEEEIKNLGENFSIAPRHLNIFKASNMMPLVIEKYKNNDLDDLDLSIPNYILKTQAEVEYERKSQNAQT